VALLAACISASFSPPEMIRCVASSIALRSSSSLSDFIASDASRASGDIVASAAPSAPTASATPPTASPSGFISASSPPSPPAPPSPVAALVIKLNPVLIPGSSPISVCAGPSCSPIASVTFPSDVATLSNAPCVVPA